MLFTFEPTNSNEIGNPTCQGTLTIEATTENEVMELHDYQHFGKLTADQVKTLADELHDGYKSVTLPKSQKRPAFQVEVLLPEQYLQPYFDLLRVLTGYNGDDFPEYFDLTDKHTKRLKKTHITTSAAINLKRYVATIIVESEPYNGKTAQERATATAHDYAAEDIGHRPFNREFVPTANGQYKENPDHGKHLKAQPAAHCHWLWNAMFQWWRSNKATAAQQQLLNDHNNSEASSFGKAYELRDNGHGSHIVGREGIRVTWGGELTTWEQFAKL